MKTAAVLCLLLIAAVDALGFTRLFSSTRLRSSNVVLYGWFDFKPMHGSGSGGNQDALDEQWEAQQAILANRRGHLDKAHLKEKYKHSKNMELESHAEPINVQKHEDEMMYFADTAPQQHAKKEPAKKAPAKKAAQPMFKMPWDK